MTNRERRLAHYKKENENTEKSGSKKYIFIQLIICMAVISCVFFGGTYKFPQGTTLYGFTKDISSKTVNITPYFTKLHSFIEQKIGEPALPSPDEDTVFTEKTVTQ